MTASFRRVPAKEIFLKGGSLLASDYVPDPKLISETLVKQWTNEHAATLININGPAASDLREKIEAAIRDAMASDTKMVRIVCTNGAIVSCRGENDVDKG